MITYNPFGNLHIQDQLLGRCYIPNQLHRHMLHMHSSSRKRKCSEIHPTRRERYNKTEKKRKIDEHRQYECYVVNETTGNRQRIAKDAPKPELLGTV